MGKGRIPKGERQVADLIEYSGTINPRLLRGTRRLAARKSVFRDCVRALIKELQHHFDEDRLFVAEFDLAGNFLYHQSGSSGIHVSSLRTRVIDTAKLLEKALRKYSE